MANPDYYADLGVSKDATDKEIEKAYKALRKKYHPDRHLTNKAEAEAKFKAVQAAYEVLSDPKKKAYYDQFGSMDESSGFGAQGGFNPFASFFQQGGGEWFEDAFQGQSSSGQPGDDRLMVLKVDLKSLLTGIKETITVNAPKRCEPCKGAGTEDKSARKTCTTCRGSGQVIFNLLGGFGLPRSCPDCLGTGSRIQNPCKSCKGRGWVETRQQLEVNVPVCASPEQRWVYRGFGGMPDQPQGTPGNLYVQLQLNPHSVFEYNGADLYCKLPLDFTTAALGGKVEVPTLDGASRSLNIPMGTQTHTQFRIKGFGLPLPRGGRGDLFCQVSIETPVSLTEKQTALLKEFEAASKALDPRQKPLSTSFWKKCKSFLTPKG